MHTINASIDVQQVGEEAVFFDGEDGVFSFREFYFELTIRISQHLGYKGTVDLLEEDTIAGDVIEIDCLVDVYFADGALLRGQQFSVGGGHLVSAYPEDLALDTLFLA